MIFASYGVEFGALFPRDRQRLILSPLDEVSPILRDMVTFGIL
jgi:hypothetical protein